MKQILFIMAISISVNSFAFFNDSVLTNFSQAQKALIDFYKQLDRNKLRSSDENIAKQVITDANKGMIKYLVQTYPDRKAQEISPADPVPFVFGLLHAMAEANQFQQIDKIGVIKRAESSSTFLAHNKNEVYPGAMPPTTDKVLPGWIVCAMEIIGGVFNVVDLYNQYVALFNGGSSFGSMIGVLGKTIKRYFGWFSAAYLVYDISSSCF